MARKAKLQGRIRYVEDWNGRGEHYLFESKWSDENEWGLDTAFHLEDDMIHYTALTKVREWLRLGVDVRFS